MRNAPSGRYWVCVLTRNAGRIARVVVLAIGAAIGAPDAGAEVECPGGEVKSFTALAERLEHYDEFTVLGVELLVSPTRPCRETWVVEVLTDGDEIAALLFDARTLEERFAGRLLVEPEEEEDELFPVYFELDGRETADLIEGGWSDDRMLGGPGPDVFVVTPGSDVIIDFDPSEDFLDLGEFARVVDGFGTLRSMADIRRAARPDRHDGRRATLIDIGGAASDWTVVLIGIRPAALTEANIVFDRDEIPLAKAPTHWPTRRVTFSDDSEIYVPPYRIEDPPPELRLIRGDDEALEFLLGVLEDIYDEHRDSD
ncbi:MAG: hypothetical protein ACFBRM_05290 [Pikeienuella sp.]